LRRTELVQLGALSGRNVENTILRGEPVDGVLQHARATSPNVR
jgi:hypothetical protein